MIYCIRYVAICSLYPAQMHHTTVAIPFPDLEKAGKGGQSKSGKKRAKRKGKGVRRYQAKIVKRSDHS